MNRIDKTFRVHILLTVIGFCLIVGGIIWGINQNAQEQYIILTTTGGTLFGLSLSWLIEEHFKRADDRLTANDLFNKAIEIVVNSLKNSHRPKERDIECFRHAPLHFYYSTKSEDGKLSWNYTIMDFGIKNQETVGRLTTETVLASFNEQKKPIYKTQLFRVYDTDNILIANRRKESKEPVIISVFEPRITANENLLSGFSYYDDWCDKWRLSPSLLAFTPIFKGQRPGRCNRHNALKLQKIWNDKFLKNPQKTVFEQYT